MLHHVSLELDPADTERFGELLELLGFGSVPAPEALGKGFKWFEREATQIHLIETPEPTVPALGHPAVAVADYEATLERLRAAGFEVGEARQLWGEDRAFARAPGGHRIELMASPPAPTPTSG